MLMMMVVLIIISTKATPGESLKKKWKKKVMHGQYIRNIDRQLISEEDTFFWLSMGDLKASEIVAAKDQALQNITRQKYWTQRQSANADFANNLVIQ